MTASRDSVRSEEASSAFLTPFWCDSGKERKSINTKSIGKWATNASAGTFRKNRTRCPRYPAQKRSEHSFTAIIKISTCLQPRPKWPSRSHRDVAQGLNNAGLPIYEGVVQISFLDAWDGIPASRDRSPNQREGVVSALRKRCRQPKLLVLVRPARLATAQAAISFRLHLRKEIELRKSHPAAFTGCPSSRV